MVIASTDALVDGAIPQIDAMLRFGNRSDLSSGALRQFLPLQNFDVLECRGARDGLAAERQKVGKRHVLLLELVIKSLADGNGGDRCVAGREALRPSAA